MVFKLFAFDCPDKKHKEVFDENNLGKLPQEFRLLIMGPPGVGKSSLIKNIMLQCSMFKTIYIHQMDGGSNEYNSVTHTKLKRITEIPELQSFVNNGDDFEKYTPNHEETEAKPPILIIFEDFNFSSLKKAEKDTLKRYLSVYSSHNNISIIISVQNGFSCPSEVKRLCTHLIIYPNPDTNFLRIICSHMGIPFTIMKEIFQKRLKTKYDFLLLDFYCPSKYKFRINMTDVFEIDE